MDMLRATTKTIIIALLLTFSSGQLARADVRNYQYDGSMPFVKMMLSMMEAMGILDRTPAYGRYGSRGYPGMSGANYYNPYVRSLAKRGLSPWSSASGFQNPYLGSYASPYRNNPFLSSPWLQSPWSQQAVDTTSPLWGTPNWGVIPMEGYNSSNSPWDYPAWSSTDLAGWVNEPWETSTWNPKAQANTQAQESSTVKTPLVQIYNSTTELQQPNQARQDMQRQLDDQAWFGQLPSRQVQPMQAPLEQSQQGRTYKPSPLSKLAPPAYPGGQSGNRPFVEPPSRTQQKPSSQQDNFSGNQKPCITEFCGLKKPDINGLWVAQNGEMLGINRQRFLWSDGDTRYLTGQIQIQNEYLLARVDDHEGMMRFKYKLAGDHLLTLQPDGHIREFVRMPVNQYRDQYQGYNPDYEQYYGGY